MSKKDRKAKQTPMSKASMGKRWRIRPGQHAYELLGMRKFSFAFPEQPQNKEPTNRQERRAAAARARHAS